MCWAWEMQICREWEYVGAACFPAYSFRFQTVEAWKAVTVVLPHTVVFSLLACASHGGVLSFPRSSWSQVSTCIQNQNVTFYGGKNWFQLLQYPPHIPKAQLILLDTQV